MPTETRKAIPAPPPFVVTNAGNAVSGGGGTPVLLVKTTTPGGDRFWSACDAALRARGSGLVGMVMHDAHSPCPLFGIAGSVLDASSLGAKWPRGGPLDRDVDDDCVDAALNWERRSWSAGDDRTDLVVRGLRAASWLMRESVERLRPGLVVNWYGSVAVFAGFESALRRLDVNRLYVERGAIPSTFVLDPIGVLAPSVPTTDPAWAAMMAQPPTAEEVVCGQRIAGVIAERRSENWRGGAPRTAPTVGGPRVIAYFGSNDLGHEFLPPDRWADAGLPFGDSERSLIQLLASVDRVDPSVQVVIKRHPHDPLKARFERFLDGKRVILDDALSVHDAADRGWIVATTSGSIGWIGIARGSNVISMSKRSYTGSGAVFEPTDDASLDRAVESALGQTISPSDPRRWAAIARCARTYAYSDVPDYLAAGVQGPEAMAQRLLRDCRATPARGESDVWARGLCERSIAAVIHDAMTCTPSYLQRHTTHAMIASRIVGRLDPARPLLVLGYGRNGREIAKAALQAGFHVTVFDDRLAGSTGDGECEDVDVAITLDGVSPTMQWVVSPLEDAGLLARVPESVRALRWREELEAFTQGERPVLIGSKPTQEREAA